MMKRFAAAVALILGLAVGATGSELTDRIRVEAQRGADALLSGDYATLIAMTHPSVVAEMGGHDAAVATVTQSIAALKAQGITVESAVIEVPSEPVAVGALVAVIVPQTKELRTPKGRFRSRGHLLAISEDGGTRWSFIDTGSLTPASLAEYFPTLAGRITLPPQSEAERLGD
jgi:hypothetical protein